MKTPRIRQALRLLAGLAISLLMIAPVQAITPIENEIQKLLANDGAAGNRFGFSVAIDSDLAAIGAGWDDVNGTESGAAYTFRWDGNNWIQQAKLIPSDGAAFEFFGRSVALDGDTVLIGAHLDDDKGSDSGAVYVFRWNGSGWVQEAKLLAADGASNDNFGTSVALNGDIALIGAPLDDDKGSNSGSAYVFRRGGSVWVQEAKLLATDGTADDRFGWSVAQKGGTALIGARLDDEMGFWSGSAYVFRWDSSAWGEEAKLTASDGAPGDWFGYSVSFNNDGDALVGAPLNDDKGTESGSAYLFQWNGSAWVEEVKFTASDGVAGDQFGWSTAMGDGTAAIGSYRDDDNGVDSGSVYVYKWNGTTWDEAIKLLASDGGANDQLSFNTGVSLSDYRVLAGAPNQGSNGTDAGAAYIFELNLDDQPPLVDAVTVTPNPVALDTVFTITASVDDTSTGGSLITAANYSINGGTPVAIMGAADGAFDDSFENVTATVGAGLSTGVYDICVTGEDGAGNVSDTFCTLLAVYDPNAGFVTGVGLIDSPEGAYVTDPTLTGRARFAFVAKYQKGANEPTGHTEFHFQAAGLNFRSNDCHWLVVAGARAQFKGVGTINGVGNYGFMITAIDEALTNSTDDDLFRIKIWDISNGDAVVYDNQIGASDSADPTTKILGGAIVIHKPKE